jgi:hypothetical protein
VEDNVINIRNMYGGVCMFVGVVLTSLSSSRLENQGYGYSFDALHGDYFTVMSLIALPLSLTTIVLGIFLLATKSKQITGVE